MMDEEQMTVRATTFIERNPEFMRAAYQDYLESCEEQGIESDPSVFSALVWRAMLEAYEGAAAVVGEHFPTPVVEGLLEEEGDAEAVDRRMVETRRQRGVGI
jgi:hypothetical protein